MSRPSDYPICWRWAFGWGSWISVWNLMFPRPRPLLGFEMLIVAYKPPWWMYPSVKWTRLMWVIRGPV